jgi:hypothetical protein
MEASDEDISKQYRREGPANRRTDQTEIVQAGRVFINEMVRYLEKNLRWQSVHIHML